MLSIADILLYCDVLMDRRGIAGPSARPLGAGVQWAARPQ